MDNSIFEDMAAPTGTRNLPALLGFLPATMLLALSVSANRHTFGDDYDIGEAVWALSGLVMMVFVVIALITPINRVESSRGWSLLVLGWAGMVCLATITMLALWANLETDVSRALFFTMFTLAIWVFGFVFILWNRLEGTAGAVAKWASIGIGVPFLVYAAFLIMGFLYGGYAT